MIRIAFVIPTLDQSGAERQLALLAGGLAAAGFDVHVIALTRGGHFVSPLESQGVTVHVIGKRFRFDPGHVFRTRRLLHALQPAIVQSFLFAANTLVRLPGVVPRGTRIVVSERCVDEWKHGWQLWLDRRLARRCDALIANSPSVAEFYRGVGVPPERMHVIPNGIPPAPALRDHQRLHEEFGIPAATRIVGCVGRLAKQKRVMDVIWAFQLLHQLLDRVHLVVIGDGPERNRLEQFARNMGCQHMITFAGHRADAYALMPGLDVFCLASGFEGMSNSLMEAMSAGVPVVVSDIAANRELVEHEVNGLVVPVGRGPDIAKAVRRLLEDATLAATLGSRAEERMRREFSVERLIERHRTLYGRLVPAEVASAGDTESAELTES